MSDDTDVIDETEYVPKHAAPTVGHGDFGPPPPCEDCGNGWHHHWERPPMWVAVLGIACLILLAVQFYRLSRTLWDSYLQGPQ